MRRPLAEECDTLFMDCPPGISLLSESVLRGADALIVPLRALATVGAHAR